jgi:hypothetical protein
VTSDARDLDDLTAFIGERLTRYVDLWESTSANLSSGTYRAEDLADDWFRLIGLAARDTAAAVALIVRGALGSDPENLPAGTGAEARVHGRFGATGGAKRP